MENMNEGSMQLLCLLISPQGWGGGGTLRLYCFTTTDGLLRDVHCAPLGYICMSVCVCVCLSVYVRACVSMCGLYGEGVKPIAVY